MGPLLAVRHRAAAGIDMGGGHAGEALPAQPDGEGLPAAVMGPRQETAGGGKLQKATFRPIQGLAGGQGQTAVRLDLEQPQAAALF